jgi:hypothetical protein
MLMSSLNAFATHPDVPLLDQNGKPVTQTGLPVDVRQSCGGCHNVDYIAVAYHFQQGRLAILSPEIYQKYYEQFGDDKVEGGLPKSLSKLDMGMYGKL